MKVEAFAHRCDWSHALGPVMNGSSRLRVRGWGGSHFWRAKVVFRPLLLLFRGGIIKSRVSPSMLF